VKDIATRIGAAVLWTLGFVVMLVVGPFLAAIPIALVGAILVGAVWLLGGLR
jgi:hypothetical protein